MTFISFIVLLISLNYALVRCQNCEPSITTTSGTAAKSGQICAGDIIFEEHFDGSLNLDTWNHEISLGGGGNNEFEWYTKNRTNSYIRNGVLFITPTLTADHFGEDFLTSGHLNLDGKPPANEECNIKWFACEQTGSPSSVIQPVKSARIRTLYSFSFKYGKVEIRAKLPAGDWLWPGIWFLPTVPTYGESYIRNGEIDLMEAIGNRHLMEGDQNIGVERFVSTLHFGPTPEENGFPTSTFSKYSHEGNGFDRKFHNYKLEWTTEGIVFAVDSDVVGTVPVGEGFWRRGNFGPDSDNVWKDGTLMAPFDHEFYILLNLAIGGTTYFSDEASNPGGKPWSNESPAAKARTDFWDGRDQWLSTWSNLEESSLQVEYVKVWAV